MDPKDRIECCDWNIPHLPNTAGIVVNRIVAAFEGDTIWPLDACVCSSETHIVVILDESLVYIVAKCAVVPKLLHDLVIVLISGRMVLVNPDLHLLPLIRTGGFYGFVSAYPTLSEVRGIGLADSCLELRILHRKIQRTVSSYEGHVDWLLSPGQLSLR
jgi:hypothetical protein